MNFKKGQKVILNIKKGSRPMCGWGCVENGDIGVINTVYDEFIYIDFPRQDAWCGLKSEIIPYDFNKNKRII